MAEAPRAAVLTISTSRAAGSESEDQSGEGLAAFAASIGAEVVARDLIGCLLVHDLEGERLVGRIVEVEAYESRGDAASHSARGPTPRNASMFGPPGHAYVYLSYGVHCCFNVVTADAGVGEAVLVRALEPLRGLESMRSRRGAVADVDLCRGPGRLSRALGFELEHDGLDLVRGPIGIHVPTRMSRPRVDRGPRIGITKSVELPWRFVERGSRHASR